MPAAGRTAEHLTADDLTGDGFRRPNALLLATDGPRAIGEFAAFAASVGPLLARAPRGDGHRVLVLPGFLADDTSTRPLRWFLRRLGYRTARWRLGRNLGPTDRIVDGLLERFASLSAVGEPISIVGWSLGGIYARELACRFPDDVRQVITLGSPFRAVDHAQSNAGRLYGRLSVLHRARVERDGGFPPARGPLPVPTTSIYTRADGIVAWMTTMEPDGPRAESVRVRGSHCGLGHNPAALRIVADRLAQPLGTWTPHGASRSR